MKLIKKGRDQKGWATEIFCTGDSESGGGCGALLLVEQDDIFTYRTGGSYCEEGNDVDYAFICSECGLQTVIDSTRKGFKRQEGQAPFPRRLSFSTFAVWRDLQAKKKNLVDEP